MRHLTFSILITAQRQSPRFSTLKDAMSQCSSIRKEPLRSSLPLPHGRSRPTAPPISPSSFPITPRPLITLFFPPFPPTKFFFRPQISRRPFTPITIGLSPPPLH